MVRPRRKRNALGTLAVALLLLALAVALFLLLAPRPIDSSQATQIPTPGQVTLPPTAPVVITATSK